MTAYLRQAHNLLSYIYGLVPVKASTEQVSLACLILCNRTLDLSLKSVIIKICYHPVFASRLYTSVLNITL